MNPENEIMIAKRVYEERMYTLKDQWHSMDTSTKLLGVFVVALFLVGGVMSGIFILSTTLIAIGAFQLKRLWDRTNLTLERITIKRTNSAN